MCAPTTTLVVMFAQTLIYAIHVPAEIRSRMIETPEIRILEPYKTIQIQETTQTLEPTQTLGTKISLLLHEVITPVLSEVRVETPAQVEVT